MRESIRICVVCQYEGVTNPVAFPFLYQGQSWVLIPESPWNPKRKFKVHGVALSLAGQELSRIVAHEAVPHYTELLNTFFQKKKLRMELADEWIKRARSCK